MVSAAAPPERRLPRVEAILHLVPERGTGQAALDHLVEIVLVLDAAQLAAKATFS